MSAIYDYIGGFESGKRSGYGKCKWKDQERDGPGVTYCTFEEGTTYDGGWLAGKYHGEGHHIDLKYEYKGKWNTGLKEGQGHAKWKDNHTWYDGGWY